MTTLTISTSPGSHGLHWTTLRHLERAWFYSCVGYAALAVFCLAAQWVDPRLLSGVSVWTKPFKFALSLSVYFATLLWCWQFVPETARRTLSAKWLVFIPTFWALAEMVYITYQGALGEHSHFNNSSTFHSIAYSLMGLGAVSLVSVLVWLAWVIARHNPVSSPLTLSIVIGLVLTFVLGGGFGGYLSSQGGHWVNAAATDANGVWFFKWATDGGDLRVAHFFGMHAMQVIPAFGLLVSAQTPRRLSPHVSLALVAAFSMAYAAFSCMTFWRAVQGQPFMS